MTNCHGGANTLEDDQEYVLFNLFTIEGVDRYSLELHRQLQLDAKKIINSQLYAPPNVHIKRVKLP
jgi:hypothetical protein